jgi:hypothetical protein
LNKIEMNFTTLCILLAVVHFVLVYVLAVVMKVSYTAMWFVSTAVTGFVAAYVRRMTPYFREMNARIKQGALPLAEDIMGGVVALMAGGVASAFVIYRTYGLGATLITAGTGAVVSSLV